MQISSVSNINRIWNVAVYVRISETEREKSESESISNQKQYIQKFIDKDETLSTYKIYSDDGFSGGSFNRPSFENMITDIEKGIIDCVIVKDLSRFGREHIQTDKYIEIYFPSKKIRFISMGENIDSYSNPKRMENIDIPFTNLINGHYLTQVSISTKSSLQIKRKEGKYVGALAPYGYIKSPYDKHKLIIDDNARDIVQRIFEDYIKGSGIKEIAMSLNEDNIPSPKKHRAIRNGSTCDSKWTPTRISKILNQPLYTGDMVQGRTYSPNHKVKKRMTQPKDKWIVVSNTHEAIISKEIYAKAQELLSRDIKPSRQKTEKATPSILAGYVYCNECGKKMLRGSATYKGKKINRFICSTYKQKGSKACSSHFIKEEALIDALHETISIYTRLVTDNTLIKKIEDKNKQNNVSSFFMSKQKKANRELNELRMIRQGLYKDYKLNVISSNEYDDMKTGFERQYNQLLKEIDIINRKLDIEKDKKMPIDEVFEYFKEFNKIKELNRRFIVNLIDRIIVDKDKIIRIVFNFNDIFEDNIKDVANLQLK